MKPIQEVPNISNNTDPTGRVKENLIKLHSYAQSMSGMAVNNKGALEKYSSMSK